MLTWIAAWACGVALHLRLPQLPPAWVSGLFAAAGIGLAVWAGVRTFARAHADGRRARLLSTAGACLGAASLAFGLAGLRASAMQAGALEPALEGVDLRVVGTVAAMPQLGEAAVRFRLDVESGTYARHALPAGTTSAASVQPPRLPGRIQLSWYRGVQRGDQSLELAQQPADLRAGDRWALTVRLRAPHGHLNPHGFDHELWLWEQGVQATGYVRASARDAPPQRLAASWRRPVERLRQAVRDQIVQTVADPRRAGIIAALVVGDQQAIDRQDWDVFRTTGVAHLMSISGLHVTMFAWLASALLLWVWVSAGLWAVRWAGPAAWQPALWLPAQQVAAIGGAACALAYALFSGWGLPAQRTVWMVGAVALLRLGGRRWPASHTWALALWVAIVADPWAMLQPGFWLSYVAVGVLLASGGPGQAAAPGLAATGIRQRLRAMLGEQLVITLALAPLGLLLFQQVSLIGVLANLLAVPWVTLVVTPLAMLGVLAEPAWTLAAMTVGGLTAWLDLLAAVPWASVSAPAAPAGLALLGVLGGILAVLRLPPGLRLSGLALVVPLLLWRPATPAPGQFSLLAIDVGQGNAVLVRTATHALLYDAGPRLGRESDAGHRNVVPLLRAQGVRLDTLVLSHRDSDHTGGAAAVLAMQPGATLLSSIEPGHELQALRPALRCEAGQQWQWDGVLFELLHPQAGDYARAHHERAARPNEVSCVLRISSAGGMATALLAGDIEAGQEQRLVREAGHRAGGAHQLRADLLLVPHHGSRTSSTPAFVHAVSPRIAVVQAGYRNRFGHPVPEVVRRYESQGARVLASPACGALRWSSAEPGVAHCWRDEARRYWHHQP